MFLRDQGRLMKDHQPTAITIDKNIGAVVSAIARIACLRTPTRLFDAMHPGDRTANVDRSYLHRNCELVKCWPVSFPVPFNRHPADMGMWIDWRRNENVVSCAGPHRLHRP